MAENRADLWPLDRDVIFLNHGSMGGCPAEVLRHQAALRAEMEAEPVRFLSREIDARLGAARQALAAFVGADPDDLAFVTNATSGVNAVLRSLVFSPGDELLTTDHAYNACRNALEFVAARAGTRAWPRPSARNSPPARHPVTGVHSCRPGRASGLRNLKCRFIILTCGSSLACSGKRSGGPRATFRR